MDYLGHYYGGEVQTGGGGIMIGKGGGGGVSGVIEVDEIGAIRIYYYLYLSPKFYNI